MAQQPSSGLGGLRARLNPNAKSFSFNPSAPSFTPQSGEQQQEVDTITKQTQDLAISDNTSTSTSSTPVTTTTTTTTTTVPTTSHLDLRGDEDELEDEEPTTTTSENKGKEVAATTTTTTTTAPSSKKQTIQVKQPDKEHLNIVFIGHVDAGKSTISGQILYLTGRVDARTIEKYEQEAKTKNRESWFLAFILDSNEEEREKGITIEVGRGYFETSKKRYTILDAPGHKDFVPNMISGASQADVAILVISARKGEFETGFERGGQTREHVTLAKTLGVKQLIVLVNKMDESTVQWAKERWDEIIDKFVPFLKEQGINPKSVIFIPCSGFTGANIKDTVAQSVCPWFKGKSFMDTLDDLPTFSRAKAEAPLRIPVTARYKEMGVVNILGKVEQGTVKKGDSLLMMPNKTPVEVMEIIDDQAEVQYALPGENVRIKIKGIEEEAIQPGFVLSDAKNPVPCVTDFLAQFLALDLKSIFSSGFSPNLHIHTTSEECTIANLVAYVDKKTGEKLPQKPKFVKTGDLVLALITVPQPICVEKFEDLQSMGRFTLRDGGKTIAIGKVMGIKKQGK